MSTENKIEKLGLVWRGNVSLYQYYHLKPGEMFGEAKQPEGSTISAEEFARCVKDRNLHGLYGPPPQP